MIAGAIAFACRAVAGSTVEWRCDAFSNAQRIYFANHSSHLDFIVIWSALPPTMRTRLRPVAGRDYWDRGAIRRRLARDVFGAVLVDRCREDSNKVDAARDAIRRMAQEMGSRRSLIVFPEGTRSIDGEIGVFKSGLYHLWRAKPNAELIPVYLENLNRILPKGEVLPVPMLSRVVFGPAVQCDAEQPKHRFLDAARRALLQLRPAR